MKPLSRVAGLVGFALLALFFAPYVLKLGSVDITLILLGGLVLAGIDAWTAD
ncbi:hypothetical protein [Tepidimonas charontis]|uniref:Uncharacterized protein n=1 Tax=Tepidimonas charontis TaxID=2267262 RepID=A0A554XES3_9BURK|nr:hypothetical protein [Tepidimonas charontis]TSE34337.1 hypothetical protein Tchar_01430 [Tepidimonas charontis]